MSSDRLQEVIARLISDPQFRGLLSQNPGAALAEYDLTSDEVAAITQGLSGEQYDALSADLDARVSRAGLPVGELLGTYFSSFGGAGEPEIDSEFAPEEEVTPEFFKFDRPTTADVKAEEEVAPDIPDWEPEREIGTPVDEVAVTPINLPREADEIEPLPMPNDVVADVGTPVEEVGVTPINLPREADEAFPQLSVAETGEETPFDGEVLAFRSIEDGDAFVPPTEGQEGDLG